eukprot:15078567-Alexandrium_andersonii.AAC.1
MGPIVAIHEADADLVVEPSPTEAIGPRLGLLVGLVAPVPRVVGAVGRGRGRFADRPCRCPAGRT